MYGAQRVLTCYFIFSYLHVLAVEDHTKIVINNFIVPKEGFVLGCVYKYMKRIKEKNGGAAQRPAALPCCVVGLSASHWVICPTLRLIVSIALFITLCRCGVVPLRWAGHVVVGCPTSAFASLRRRGVVYLGGGLTALL